MRNANKFKLGVFSMNVSHGTTITTAPGTLVPTWEQNVQIAQAADEAGWEFLLPLGRWRGFGGRTNFNDNVFEVYTWAAGIAAITKQIQVFTTSHTRVVHPLMAAKQGATVDHISGGRSGLNIVAGQKGPEISMFGIEMIDHDDTYEASDEWFDLVKRFWTDHEDFDYEGTYYRVKGGHMMPKPLQKPYPYIVNAGLSPRGRLFGAKHADGTFFAGQNDLQELKAAVKQVRETAWREARRGLAAFNHCYVVCRDTEKEALEYVRYYVDECGDWEAADRVIRTLIGADEQSVPREKLRNMQRSFIAGWTGFPLVGTPEQIVDKIIALSEIGLDGAALHWVDYEAGIEVFNQRILPLLVQVGLREK